MSFNLNRHIREILAVEASEDLGELTDAVLRGIATRDIVDALRQALPTYIRTQLGDAERPTDSRAGQVRPDAHSGPAGAGTNSPDGYAIGGATSNHAPRPVGGPSRVTLFRRNRFRVSVWIGEGQYRSILECTIENLEHAAAESDRHVESNAARARQYRRLTKKMRERAVATVAELTDAEIQEALTDE